MIELIIIVIVGMSIIVHIMIITTDIYGAQNETYIED